MMKVIASGVLAVTLIGSAPAWAGKGLRLPSAPRHHHHHHHQPTCYWDHYNEICVPRGS